MTKKAKKLTKDSTMHRQGDLLFIKCEQVPEETGKTISDGVIARGESTGHTHRIGDLRRAALVLIAGALYVKARQQIEILHEEHAPVVLPPGVWKVKRQREYTPDGWRQVAD